MLDNLGTIDLPIFIRPSKHVFILLKQLNVMLVFLRSAMDIGVDCLGIISIIEIDVGDPTYE
jgi:hypothetical protein